MSQYCSADRSQMNREAAREMVLEELADHLLAQAPLSPREAYPFYSERALRRAVQRDETHPFLETASLPPVATTLQLALRLLTRSHLAPRKRLAFRLVARGYTYRETAQRLQMSSLQVRRWIEEVCQELREQVSGLDTEPRRTEDIREVLRADMSRYGYSPERHCKPGQEACRVTGLCTRRWYLHYLSD